MHFAIDNPANPWFVELEGRSIYYQGQHAVTIDGVECQPWDTQTPKSHGYTEARHFPDKTVEDAGNYCRRMDEIWLWCYTMTTSERWDWCGKFELICDPSKGELQSLKPLSYISKFSRRC